MSQETRLVIPPGTILTVAAVLLGLWVLYLVRDIVFLFLIVLAIVVTFSPIVRELQRVMPRTLAIILLYALLILLFVGGVAILIPPVVSQLADFVRYLQGVFALSGVTSDTILDSLRNTLDLTTQGKTVQAINPLLANFKGSLGAVYTSTLGLLGGIVAAVTVFITSFYLLLEEKNFHDFVSSLVPEAKRVKIAVITDRMSKKMGDWLRGQFSLMVIVGAVTGVALAILGVPYPLLLGLWAGLMELIPLIGPVVGAIPGVFLAFSTGGLVKGLIVLAVYFVVQQIENQFLVPKIMGRVLGLSPVVIIFSLLVGGKLFGLLGVIIAVPITAALAVMVEEWRKA